MPTRGLVLSTTLVLLALPVLSACSGDPKDDVRAAAAQFLDDWSGGDVAGAAALSTDADATTALLQQTAEDLPDAALTAELGAVTVGAATTCHSSSTWRSASWAS